MTDDDALIAGCNHGDFERELAAEKICPECAAARIAALTAELAEVRRLISDGPNGDLFEWKAKAWSAEAGWSNCSKCCAQLQDRATKAEAALAAETERCAKVCDEWASKEHTEKGYAGMCAATIRALGRSHDRR